MDKITLQIKSLTIIVAIFCLQFLCNCCSSDTTEKLGNGYFYRNEGGQIKDILYEYSNGGEVPATVVDFVYDKKFIIAKQKPKLPQDPLYEKVYEYKNGVDVFYYWIIIKENKLVLGPLDKTNYNNVRIKYNIPNELQIKL